MKKCVFWALAGLCLMGASVSCTNTSVDEELQELRDPNIYNVDKRKIERPSNQGNN